MQLNNEEGMISSLKMVRRESRGVDAAVEDMTPESEHELQALQCIMEVPEEA